MEIRTMLANKIKCLGFDVRRIHGMHTDSLFVRPIGSNKDDRQLTIMLNLHLVSRGYVYTIDYGKCTVGYIQGGKPTPIKMTLRPALDGQDVVAETMEVVREIILSYNQ